MGERQVLVTPQSHGLALPVWPFPLLGPSNELCSLGGTAAVGKIAVVRRVQLGLTMALLGSSWCQGNYFKQTNKQTGKQTKGPEGWEGEPVII